MNVLISSPRRRLTVWLSAFFSPILYFLLLLLVDRFQLPPPPEALVASLFFLIPVVALLVCEFVVWSSDMTQARKVGWMLFTLLAMALQFGVLLTIIAAAITVMISPAQ